MVEFKTLGKLKVCAVRNDYESVREGKITEIKNRKHALRVTIDAEPGEEIGYKFEVEPFWHESLCKEYAHMDIRPGLKWGNFNLHGWLYINGVLVRKPRAIWSDLRYPKAVPAFEIIKSTYKVFKSKKRPDGMVSTLA